MRFDISESKAYAGDFKNGAIKGLIKGAFVGLAVGAGMYIAGIAIAAAGIPMVSSYLLSVGTFGQFSLGTMVGFAAFNSLFFGVSGGISGGIQERAERQNHSRSARLEKTIELLEKQQGKDDHFRMRTEALLDAVEQESTHAPSTSAAIQNILSKSPTSAGNYADKVLADRAEAQSSEAALA